MFRGSPCLRMTEYGPVAGQDDAARTGTWSWKGIPFAKAPLGPLRWRSPQAPDPWRDPIEATAFGPAAPQLGYLHGPGLHNTFDETVLASLGQPLGSEDCLHLNIWRPATEASGLPVIFFIFGGAKVSGYPADPLYDGAVLARRADAVVVTANYRLGVLGWFDLPQLKRGEDPLEDSGNFGTLDQILALRFVQRNIAAFGGDPGNVTVIGHSAGAADACALLTSPAVTETRPQLIHRAVLLSGGLALAEELPPGSIPLLRPAAYARMQATTLLHTLLVGDGHAPDPAAAAAFAASQPADWVAGYLRAKAPGELLAALFSRLLPLGLGQVSHIPDGRVVADTPLAAIRAGRYLKVPLILSTTRDEAKLFPGFLALSPALGGVPALAVSDARRLELMASFREGNPEGLRLEDLVHPAYLPVEAPGTGYEARMALLTHLFFATNRQALLDAFASRQRDLWCCRFDWDGEPAPWDTVYGAAHLFDIPFLFGTFGSSLLSGLIATQANAPGRLALSEAMMGAVAAFARTGDPSHAGLGSPWPAWPATLRFDAGPEAARITLLED